MRYITTIVLLFISLGLFGQGIEFFEGTWEEAIEKASKEEKVIFVDAYTTWCGPCKRMAANVFPDEEVGKFFNKHFVNMKLDMEKGEGLKFRNKYPVSAFPTLFFIDAKGELVQKIVGAQSIEKLLEIGYMILGKQDNSEDLAARYEEGERDPAFILEYVTSLNDAGKNSLKVANDYLYTQENFNTPFNLKFIFEACTEADSRIFDLMVDHKEQLVEEFSQEAFERKVMDACTRTLSKAIEFEAEFLLEEAKEKMDAHYPDAYKTFALEADMAFYRNTGQVDAYLDVCKDYVKKEIKKDPMSLNNTAVEIMEAFDDNADAMQFAEKVAERAVKQEEKYQYYWTLAEILLENGKKKEALDMAKKSLQLCEQNIRATKLTERLIYRIEQS